MPGKPNGEADADDPPDHQVPETMGRPEQYRGAGEEEQPVPGLRPIRHADESETDDGCKNRESGSGSHGDRERRPRQEDGLIDRPDPISETVDEHWIAFDDPDGLPESEAPAISRVPGSLSDPRPQQERR